MLRKFKADGFIIVQGAIIQVLKNYYYCETKEMAFATMTHRLKLAFEKEGDIIELDNCIFEKKHCAGVFCEMQDLGPAHNIFKRIWDKIPKLRWK